MCILVKCTVSDEHVNTMLMLQANNAGTHLGSLWLVQNVVVHNKIYLKCITCCIFVL